MTEVPEHLLKRAQAARNKAAGGSAPADESSGEGAAASSQAVEPAGGGGAVAAAAATPAPAAEPAYTGPPQRPRPRQRVPAWAMPVIVALPLWAVLYGGAFGERHVEAVGTVAQGQTIYAQEGCGGCHNPDGLGQGSNPSLANVNETFPNFADHVSWVRTGSAPFKGQTYGNSGRVATGGMPAFENLSDEEVIAVVCHERVTIGKASQVPAECLDTVPGGAEGEGSGGGSDESSGHDG